MKKFLLVMLVIVAGVCRGETLYQEVVRLRSENSKLKSRIEVLEKGRGKKVKVESENVQQWRRVLAQSRKELAVIKADLAKNHRFASQAKLEKLIKRYECFVVNQKQEVLNYGTSRKNDIDHCGGGEVCGNNRD